MFKLTTILLLANFKSLSKGTSYLNEYLLRKALLIVQALNYQWLAMVVNSS